MNKLIETKLQKVILLIGGFLIFFRLIDVSYYNRYNAIFTSIGISVLIIVLLIFLRDYHPKFHLKIIGFIKKHKRLLIYLIIFIFLVLLMVLILRWYLDFKEMKAVKAEQEKFHNTEIAYQKCLDKVASITTYPETHRGGYIPVPVSKRDKIKNKYFDEWIEDGRPNYNQVRGHWEWGFMEWMMEKYPEFCSEYNTYLINYFLEKKEVMILGLPELPKLPNLSK